MAFEWVKRPRHKGRRFKFPAVTITNRRGRGRFYFHKQCLPLLMGWKFCNIGLDHDTGRIIMKKVDSNGIDAFELQKGDAYYRIDSVQIIKAIGIKDREVGTLKDIGGDRLVIEFEFSKKPEE